MSAYLELRLKVCEIYPLPSDWLRALAGSDMVAGEINLQGAALTVWHAIFVRAEEVQRTGPLLDFIIAETPTCRPFCDAYRAELAAGIPPSPRLPGSSLTYWVAAAKGGLDAVATLPKDQRRAFAAIERLASITEGIELLGHYKDLHDKMQMFDYEIGAIASLMLAAERMTAEPKQLRAILSFARRLGTFCQQCDATVQHLPDARRGREMDWLTGLSAAQLQLKNAPNLKVRDAVYALYIVRSTLRSVPVALDLQISVSAKDLPLAALAEGLGLLVAQIADSDPSRRRLETARQAVLVVSATIQARVVEHQLWQQVDAKFAAIGDLIETAEDLDGAPQGRLPLQFSMAWRQTLLMVDVLADLDPQAGWTQPLRDIAENVTAKLTSEVINMALILDFEAYRDSARSRFMQVDFALKDEFQSLSTINTQLNGLLG